MFSIFSSAFINFCSIHTSLEICVEGWSKKFDPHKNIELVHKENGKEKQIKYKYINFFYIPVIYKNYPPTHTCQHPPLTATLLVSASYEDSSYKR